MFREEEGMSGGAEGSLKDISNAAVIEAEIAWFQHLLDLRFRMHAGEAPDDYLMTIAPSPELPGDRSSYAEAVRSSELSGSERLVLILALLPHLRPEALDPFLIPNPQTGRAFTEFGGEFTTSGGFRPTRQTALFLLAGSSLQARIEHMRLFAADARLHAAGILQHPSGLVGQGPWTPLIVDPAWVDRLVIGEGPSSLERALPGGRLETEYDFSDLVLPHQARDELENIVTWMRHEQMLLGDWGFGRHVRPGYRALFHGPSGTGKTMVAAVVGKTLGRDVYRVDLAGIQSKYPGETEKKLALLFDGATDSGAILCLDEADAMFGRRSEPRTAEDRHANLDTGRLIQRIENFPGLIILSSSRKSNLDDTLLRRLNVAIEFPMPDKAARLQLWRRCFTPHGAFSLGGDVDLDSLARAQLSGGAIVNILRQVGIRLAGEGRTQVQMRDLVESIDREMGAEDSA